MNPDVDVFGDGAGSPRSINIEGAQLILELYGRRFEDKDGDPSDQPATSLTACEGSFSFVLLDAERDAAGPNTTQLTPHSRRIVCKPP